MKRETVYIGIGSNLGDRLKNINAAIDFLRSVPGVSLEKVSSIIEAEPEGGVSQGKFLNGAIKIRTTLSPFELLKVLQEIEAKLKRVRRVKNAPRTIDLDILLYADKKIDDKGLTVPHPRMLARRFVVVPLLELEPSVLDAHPLLKELS